jgi:hypothetical protein
MSSVEVYQYPDVRPVNLWCTLGLFPLEKLSEGLIDDVGDGQVIEVRLAADRVNPASFDMEGGALGFAAGIVRLVQGGFAFLPPDNDFLKVIHHGDNHIFVYIRYTFSGHHCSSVERGSRFSGHYRSGVERGRRFERLEAIPNGRARGTKPLGDLILGETFGLESAELGSIDLGSGHGSSSLVEVSHSYKYTLCLLNVHMGEVYPGPDLEQRANEGALRQNSLFESWSFLGVPEVYIERNELCPLAVALVNETEGFVGDVLFHEMCVPSNDGL